MKIKKVLLCLLLCVLAFSAAGCGRTLIDAPAKADAIIGNGGFAVQKGDYLYFTNGFLSVSNVTKSTRDDKYVTGSLYVTKLENGALKVDEDGVLTDYDVLYHKLVGFEEANLYIFGDYIYFATPNTKLNRDGTLDNDVVKIFRMKLNGSSGAEQVLATAGNASTFQYEFFCKDNTAYLLFLENKNLYRISCGKNIGDKQLVCKDVSSIVMPKQANYPTSSTTYNEIYFTTNLTEEEAKTYSGNKIVHYNIATNETEQLRLGKTFTIIDSKNGKLYYTIADNSESSSDTTAYLYVSSYAEIAGATATKIAATTYTNYYIFDDSSVVNKVLAISDTNLRLIDVQDPISSTSPSVLTLDGFTKFLFIQNEYVYYTTSTYVMRYSMLDKVSSQLIKIEDFEIKTDLTFNVDYDARYLYSYVKLTNDNGDSYYMYRTDTLTNEDGVLVTEFVGVYATKDIPDSEDEE